MTCQAPDTLVRTAIQTQALQELARVIAAAPAELFCMGAVKKQTDCGTAFCAAGWAMQDAWFQQNTELADQHKRWEKTLPWPAAQELWHSVLPETFGLSIGDANLLFGGDLGFGNSTVTKKKVIANIERVLAGQEPEQYAAVESEQ